MLAIVLLQTLIACDGQEGANGERPPATSATSPPATQASPSAGPSAIVPILTGPCCFGLALEAGRYASPSWFEAPFTLDVEDGFLGVAAELERLILLGRGQSRAGNLERYVGFFVAPSAKALVRQLRSTPGAEMGPVSSTTVDARPAVEFEAEAPPSSDTPPNDEIVPGAIRIPAIDRLVPTFFYTESVPARMRFVVVDLGDRALLIYVEAPAERFASFATDVARMLGSIGLAG